MIVEQYEGYAGILDWIKEHIFGQKPQQQEAKQPQTKQSLSTKELLIGAAIGGIVVYFLFKAGKHEAELKEQRSV